MDLNIRCRLISSSANSAESGSDFKNENFKFRKLREYPGKERSKIYEYGVNSLRDDCPKSKHGCNNSYS